MIAKFLEAFFQHKRLLLLPPLLLPLIVGPIALVMAPAYYETWTGIWVERPTYLAYNDDWNRYYTPAQNQTGRLSELLRTRTFLLDVAKNTPLAPLIGTQKGEQRIAEVIAKGLTITPNGNQLVLIRFRGETPQLSFQMVTSMVDTFKEKVTADRANQAGLAISFFESRQQTAQDQFRQANDALRRYIAANPRLTTIDPSRGAAATTASRLGLPAAAIDPQLAELLRQLEIAQGDVDRARNALDQARLDVAAAMEGQELGFQIVDAPQMPTAPIRERRRMLLYPVAALLVGIGLSGTMLVLLVAGDRSARSEHDLEDIASVIGTVSDFQVKSIRKKLGPTAARRAVGFVAGAALPLPGPAK